MNYLSICAIVKNETKYIEDWMLYHRALGVDHFYIYDNENEPTYEKLLRDKYTEQELTVVHMPGKTKQPAAYMHCLVTRRKDSRWISFLDVDEYLVPKTNLPQLLSNYEFNVALCPHWILFGSNGHKEYEPIPVPLRFTRCANEVDRHVKSIVDPLKTVSWVTAHKFKHITGQAVDENRIAIPDLESRPENPTAELIYIAHYVTKSLAESWDRRFANGATRADMDENRKMPEFFYGHDRNDVENLDVANLWNIITGKVC